MCPRRVNCYLTVRCTALRGSRRKEMILLKFFLGTFLIVLNLHLIGFATAQNLQLQPEPSAINISTHADSSDVQHVIAAYREAVLAHDGARLSKLFLPDSLWLNVLSTDAYERARAKDPDAKKVRTGNYANFAKMVSGTKSNMNPTHTALRVQSDGTIASVYFHFVFFTDGKEQNRGSETWVLVKGVDGWRIAAITYSSTPPMT
jgi:uncharacterized protein (TIGR02246 family)